MAFGLVLFLAIPVSVGISGMIRQTYAAQFEETVALSEDISEAAAQDAQAAAEVEAEGEKGAADEASNGGLLENLKSTLSGIPEAVSQLPSTISRLPGTVADSVSNAISTVTDQLNGFVNRYLEGFAVMVVTSCLLPIVVVLIFFWFANTVLGMNISVPRMVSARLKGMRAPFDDEALNE